jgi:hypothetical protein
MILPHPAPTILKSSDAKTILALITAQRRHCLHFCTKLNIALLSFADALRKSPARSQQE